MARRFGLMLKLVSLAMILTVIPTSVISIYAVQHVQEMGDYALDSNRDLGETAANDSADALRSLGEEMIMHKAVDTGEAVQIYLQEHPNMTTDDIKNSTALHDISVESVGVTGYTAIVDADHFVILTHKYPNYVGMQLTGLKDSLPSFWAVIERSAGGKTSWGYYDWKEPDGSIRQKYAYIAPINVTTADGVMGLTCWATTYIDEFLSPVNETRAKIVTATADTNDYIDKGMTQLSDQLIMVIGFAIVVVIICSIGFAQTISRPIYRLKRITEHINKGDLSKPVDIKSSDEIGDLAASFDGMRLSLKSSYETLEGKVVDRTKELERAKSYSDNIVRSMADTLIVVAPNGNIYKVNQSTLDLLGYKSEDGGKSLKGRPVDKVIVPVGGAAKEVGKGNGKGTEAPLAAADAMFERLGLGDLVWKGFVKDVEVDYITKDGKHVPVSFSGSVMRTKTGKLQGIVCVAKDITGRKRLEWERQKAKEAAEEATRAKSEFLANMSHEIRTPLNGVMGMINLTLDTPLNDEQKEYLTLAESSADSLMTIINDILDFSKIEAKKLDLDNIEFDLVRTLEETMTIHSIEANQKHLELMVEIEPTLQSALIGDPQRLKQVITNLVKNAIKFTDKGHVLLKVETMKGPSENVAKLHFSIKDTGVGIPKEKQTQVFEMFTQLDSSSTKRHQGAGLGLTISKNLVEMMGGELRVESEPGKGSTFHFTATFGIQKEKTSISEMREVELKGWRALIVDDNEINRTILRKTLESWGMTVTEAKDGAECLEELYRVQGKADEYRMLLVDCWMPTMDGIELIKRMRDLNRIKDTIIMMLSSVEDREVREQCKEWGISYLVKPVRPSSLMDAIMNLMARTQGPGDAPMTKEVASEKLMQDVPAGFKVLLAEDNTVNRTLVLRLLEKVGIKATSVENGMEVLKAMGKVKYDLILMDVQMPEMDGVEATRRIRELEGRLGGHVHIIALTAHAMKGDMERFLAAGMDDYLSKPLRAELLYERIWRAAKGKHGPMPTPTPTSSREVPPPKKQDTALFDMEGLMSRTDNDKELACNLIELYMKQMGESLAGIEDAIAKNDAKRLEFVAHSFKGASASVSAEKVREMCLSFEKMGASGDISRASAMLTPLKECINSTKGLISKYMDECKKEKEGPK